jgi:hypothetical protein
LRTPSPRRALALASLALFAPLAPAQRLVRSLTTNQAGQPLLGVDDVEITPDGTRALVRENRVDTESLVLDLATGAWLASSGMMVGDGVTGVTLDAVRVTDARGVVLGNSVHVLDLANLAAPLLANHAVGANPRDLALTPDGTLAVVRGGSGPNGGQYVLDLASGALAASHLGNQPNPYPNVPTSWALEVDDVVASDTHAVLTSFVPVAAGFPRTRVTIWELRPAGGGPPAVAFESAAGCAGCEDQDGGPHDLALTPDGTKAAVRSELEIALYDLSASPPARLWLSRLEGDPGLFQDDALDSLEVSNTRVATLSRRTGAPGGGAQLDLFDLAGGHWFDRFPGSPHDLALAPDGSLLVLRTSAEVRLYDLANLPAVPQLAPLGSASAPGATTDYLAGLDSVAASDSRAVTLTQEPVTGATVAWLWAIGAGGLTPIATATIPEGRPLDLELLPDGERAALSMTNGVAIVHVDSGAILFRHQAVTSPVWYPWCDGIAADDEHVVAFGYSGSQSGWIDVVDVAPFGAPACSPAPNSVGPGAQAAAGGTPGVAANDFRVVVTGAPPRAIGAFAYGAPGSQTPFGEGALCVNGPLHFVGASVTSTAGGAGLRVDLASPPAPAGQITPGSTWSFVFLYRDPLGGPAGFNASGAIDVTFAP